jgi:CRISPR-associated protein Csx10
MITGNLTITMRSDWHIGSGTGRPGNIDRLVQRDTHNLPYIPAKSLTGIWRDGCELVAQGLDAGGQTGSWQQWVNWLFGEQQPEENKERTKDQAIATAPLTAKLSVRSAHFSKPLQDAFRGNVTLQSMTAFVKPGVKINPHTGSALADHLRFEEMTRAGAVLEAEYCLSLDGLNDAQQQIAKAILVAGALMVERLGAKRRRGAGRCEISVKGLSKKDTAIAAIENTKGKPPAPPSLPVLKPREDLALEADQNESWWRIALNITTQSPVIIHKRTVGNHQETQDYIPGTYFVPIILKQLGAYFNTTALSNALMHGDVVITNANPVIHGNRAEAVPFAIFEPKAKTETVTIHQRIGEAIETEIADGQQIKGIRRGYVSLEEQTLQRVVVNPEIAAHNTIVDAKQRPDAEVGGIYTYAAIPAGLTFQLEVRIRDGLVPKNAVNPLAKFLTTETSVQIGRTKKDDYGKVKLKQVKSGKIADSAQKQPEILTIWLLSDLLLRDERLRPTVDPQVLGKCLAKELGVTLTLLKEPQSGLPQIDSLVAFARSSRTESWQTKWGLPRPSLVGLSAGTVLQFSVSGGLNSSKLQSLEISGFGERTAEGYGQMCFNPPLLIQKDIKIAQGKEKDTGSSSQRRTLVAKKDPGYSYAKLIETETWREMIRRAAGAIAAEPEKITRLKPLTHSSNLTRSKLSTLRSLIDSLSSHEDKRRILTIMGNMAGKKNWQGETLIRIQELVENEETVWECYQEMGIDFSQYRLTQDNEATIKQELWVEAVRILVDACVRAHKRASEQIKTGAS